MKMFSDLSDCFHIQITNIYILQFSISIEYFDSLRYFGHSKFKEQ